MKRRRGEVIGGGAAVTELPDDVILEILVRVSCASSLWSFRCVCKSWCSMISSTNFIEAHLKNSLITSNFMVLSTTVYKPTIKIRPLHTLLFKGDLCWDDLCSAYNVDLSPVFMNYDHDRHRIQLPVCIVSTCNGLCLLQVNKRDFYLWNPFIKQVRKLPDFVDHRDLLEHPDGDDGPIVISFSAFGFDERSHDYKIVALIRYLRWRKRNTTKFYSLKTDSWTRISSDFFECDVDHGIGKFLNGEIHWLTRWRSSTLGLQLVSLDLTSHVLRASYLPSKVSRTNAGAYGKRPILSVHGECLHLLCVGKPCLYLWVCKDDGDPAADSSWDLVSLLPHLNLPNYKDRRANVRFLYMTEEAGVLFSQGRKNYIKQNWEFRYPHFRSSYPNADICIQSLVSPFPDGMVKEKSQTRFNASESPTGMKGSGEDTQGHVNAGSVNLRIASPSADNLRWVTLPGAFRRR